MADHVCCHNSHVRLIQRSSLFLVVRLIFLFERSMQNLLVT